MSTIKKIKVKKWALGVAVSSLFVMGAWEAVPTDGDVKPYIRSIEERKRLSDVHKEKLAKKEASIKKARLQKVSAPKVDTKPIHRTVTLDVEATAYTADCVGCSGITATGVDVRNATPNIIAVDPAVIPLGTVVEMFIGGVSQGYYTAEDTGGAIKGYHIDVLVPDYDTAIQFGRRPVTLKIVEKI